MTPDEGTIVAERFRLVRPLGRGGMGDVWLAEHASLDIPCAIKFIQGDAKDSSEVRQRFEREAKIAAQIRSPHVVQILDHGVWGDTPYIAMELLEGEDLDDRLQRVQRLTAVEAASITAQVARALSRAHAAGLVHRDLKPANIFIAQDDDREIVKVLDFGIAKDSAPRMSGTDSTTKTGAILGTPAYMSPEQAQGVKRIDHRSDLWSLAVVVFECLTGQLPFRSEAFGDLLLKIMVHPLPVPSQIAPLPTGFDAWWTRAASRDPEGRFQSAKEMSDALILALGISGEISSVRFSLTDPFGGALSLTGRREGDSAEVVLPREARAISEAETMAAGPQDSGSGIHGRTPDPAAPAEASRSVRRRPHTAGPVSTSVPMTPAASQKSTGRFVLAVLAGAAVAGIGAAVLLRNVAQVDPAPASEPSAEPEPSEPVVTPAPLDTAAPDLPGPPDTAEVAPPSTAAPASTNTVPVAPAATSAVAPPPHVVPSPSRSRQSPTPATAPSHPRPPPTSTTKKKPGLNDFGI